MSGYKYACPYCGQHIEYTEGYAGQRMPCPMCQQSIMFPAIPSGLKKTSSLRLVRDIPKPVQQFHFSFAGLFLFLREHWKVIGTCLVPFAVLAGALLAASSFRHSEPPPAPAPAPTATAAETTPSSETEASSTSDPPPVPTDLTQASQQVQARLSAVKQASAALQAAQKNNTAIRQQYADSPAGEASEKSAEAACQAAQKSLTAAKTAFGAAFTNYQAIGGPIDYRRQLP
jgi:DNA-directed RNA polymerase subunit RPC12/RpoP